MQISPQFKLHFIVLLWGFTGVVGKLIAVEALPLVWIRMLFAFSLIYIFIRYKKIPLSVDKKFLFQLFGIGFLIGLHWFTFFYAIKVSTVAIAVSTLSTGAFFSSILEMFLLKKKINIVEKVIEMFFSLIVFVCLIIIFKAESKYYLGIIIGLICTFLSALFSVLNARIYTKTNSSVITFYEILGGWLLISILFIPFGNYTDLLSVSWMDIFWLLILAGLLTVYPMIESVNLLKHFSPFTILLTINLEPVYGIIIAYFIWDDEKTMSTTFYVCTAVILLVIVANGLLKKRFTVSEKIELQGTQKAS